MPGSGKSTLAKALASITGYQSLDLDEKIESTTGKMISDIFTEDGEDYFRKLEAEQLKLLIETKTQFILSSGGGTPCFHDNMELINQSGYSVFLNVEVDELVERLKKEAHEVRPLVSQHGKDLEQYLNELLTERIHFYQQAHLIWDSKYSPEKLIEKLGFPTDA